MLLALLVGVPCQRLAPTAGKSEAEVSGGAEVEAAQPLVVEHSCLLLQPLPAHPHKAQTQSPAHRQSLTFIPSGTPSFTAIYLFSSTKGFPNKKHLDGAILICTVSLVGKLLTPVFPPCPNSIANLFSTLGLFSPRPEEQICFCLALTLPL